MTARFYRDCEVCGGPVHSGSYCACMKKADPWGSLQKHVEMNRHNMEVLQEINDARKSLEAAIYKAMTYRS